MGAVRIMRSNHDPGRPALRSRILAPMECARREERRRTIGKDDVLHEPLQVGVVIGEGADVALAGVGRQPRGAALAAPVHGGDGEAAAAKVGHDLEILLDILTAAAEQADGAAARARASPATAHSGASRRRRHRDSRGRAAGNRVLGQRHELHAVDPPLIFNCRYAASATQLKRRRY